MNKKFIEKYGKITYTYIITSKGFRFVFTPDILSKEFVNTLDENMSLNKELR